jgi:hypothetical protein
MNKHKYVTFSIAFFTITIIFFIDPILDFAKGKRSFNGSIRDRKEQSTTTHNYNKMPKILL